jgi:hypothetical protein
MNRKPRQGAINTSKAIPRVHGIRCGAALLMDACELDVNVCSTDAVAICSIELHPSRTTAQFEIHCVPVVKEGGAQFSRLGSAPRTPFINLRLAVARCPSSRKQPGGK